MAKISTYPSADNPLLLSDRLIGTEAIRPVPSPTPLATKNFSLADLLQLFSANFPAASLQAVLNTGNTATQNITLTGTITTTLIKPINIEDTSGSQGLTFQVLSKGTSSINWVNIPVDTLQAVLNAGNTATQNITLIGDITSTKIIPGNIQDELGFIGIAGQLLSKTATGIKWIVNPTTLTPGLGDVLSVSNTATNNITLIGNITATSIIKSGGTNLQYLMADGSISTGPSLAGYVPYVGATTNLNMGAFFVDASEYKFLDSAYSVYGSLFLNSEEFIFKVNPTTTLARLTYGQLLLQGISLYSATLTYTTLTADRTYALPNASGTIALTSNIPTVTPSALTKTDDTNVTLTLGGSPNTALLAATSLTLGWTGTLADSRIASASNWNTAYTNRITSLTTTGTGAATLISNVLNIPISNTGTVTSIGITVPSAFNVTPSTITSSGTFTITGAGVASQYVRGDGTLANFPTSTGGGASVSYYLNGSVSQGTIGGVAYKEMNGVPVIGTGTDFTINADGYIAQFITDVGDPNKLLIPAGNWNFETYFSASSSGGTPRFYIELYKYDGATFTLIATNSATPEYITGGTSIDLYFTALAVPATTLLVTDRLAARFYVIHSGRTITMHTEDSHLSQIITTFSSGLTALNGLTSQVQYFAVGTTGTNFNISSIGSTHTFNLPTASAANRGALSSADWSAFNGKQIALSGTGIVKSTSGTISYITDNSINWNTAYTSRIASLTTTGSGAATLISNVLNIPTPSTNGTLFTSSSITYQGAAGTLQKISTAIPSNIFTSGDLLKLNIAITTTALSVAIAVIEFYINSSATIVGATLIGRYNGPIGNQYIPVDRFFWVSGTNFYGRDFTASASTSTSNSIFAINNVAIPTTQFYIITQVTTTSTDRACISSINIAKS